MIVKVFKNLSPCVSREATCFLHATLIPTEECVNQMGGDITWDNVPRNAVIWNLGLWEWYPKGTESDYV